MSCELHREIVLLDTGRLSPSESAQLEAHAANCDECRETVERMRAANAALAIYRPSASPSARVRVWEQMSAPRARSRDAMRFLVPAAAALAIAVVMIDRHGRDEGAAPPRSRIEVADGTRYQVVSKDPEHVQIELEHGRVHASVDHLEDNESFEVITRDARIVVRETSFVVDADGDATSVEVQSGEIVLWPRSGALPVTLGAGRKLKLIAKKPVITAPPQIAVEQKHELERSERHEREQMPARGQSAERAEQQANTLATARAALAEDAPRAAALAEDVLKERPSERLEAEAIAVLADAQRRRGLTREAADLYQRVARHAQGRPFAEEALMQRALLLAEIEGPKAALEDLEEAAQRFPNGPTAPERTTLSARLHLALGDAAGAADVIERARVSGVSLSLLETRIAVGRALLDSQPERVRALLAPALDPSAPEDIRKQAMDMIQGGYGEER